MENETYEPPTLIDDTMSPQLDKLAAALSKAQEVMNPATKDKANPFFKHNYADLTSVWDAAREPLAANGLSIVQTTDGTSEEICVVTTMLHTSGQWIRGRLRMTPVKKDPQGIGSCITYARRYALAAIVGICPEDDDGNEASKPTAAKRTAKKAKPVTPKVSAQQAAQEEIQDSMAEPDFPAPDDFPPDELTSQDMGGTAVEPGEIQDTCTFGKNKGTAWALMTIKQLEWYHSHLSAAIDNPAKQGYMADNMAALRGVQAEMESR